MARNDQTGFEINMIKDKITQERLKYLFNYNEDTGLFTRLVTIHYNAKSGDIANHVDKSTGYVSFNIDGRIYYAHRLAWFYKTGKWADKIDHIDGIKTNNKWINLRNGTHAQNLQNYKKANSHNKSGLLGAHMVNNNPNHFTSEIIKNGKRKFLGTFKTAEEAHKAYLEAKRKLHEFNTL